MAEVPREQLEAELMRLRTMVGNTTEGIAVGRRGELRFANDRCLQMVGIQREQAIGRPLVEFLHPDDRDFANSQRERRAVGERLPTYEVRFQRPDGGLLWVELNSVVIEWEGVPAALFFLKDTTERHRLDDALKAALAQREAMLQTATVGVTFLVNRRHQWLNRTMGRILGYEPGELLGQETRVHYANDEDFERIGAQAYAEIARHGTFSAEVRMKRKDGELIWVQIDGTAVAEGGPQGTVWTYVDTTRRRQAEQEVQAALARERELGELKTRLLSMASHEFRTPLAAILSSAELLGHYGDRIDPEEQGTILSDMVAAARRMQLMLDDMFTLGQAEAGRLRFNPQPADPQALCRAAVQEVKSAYPTHRLRLEVQRGGVRAIDARLLQYVMSNLLVNACKYSPEGSEVVTRLDCCPQGVRIEVEDHGIGIAPEELPHLFESFRRGANSGHRPGSGLGLAIVKRCTELHGGEVSVVSTLGVGSTFTVTLPGP